jgi:hypothetical protein
MNLLEHYIEEVYDVKTVNMDGGWSFVEVDMMVDCYGSHKRIQKGFINMKEWEEVKQLGYYIA